MRLGHDTQHDRRLGYGACAGVAPDPFLQASLSRRATTRADFPRSSKGIGSKARWLIASAMLLEKVCEYMYFNIKYQNAPEVPEFDPPPGMALELLVAADYLDSGSRGRAGLTNVV